MVLEAENGREALEIIREKHNDLSAVVLDLIMPVMDGRELLSILRQDDQYQNLPILIATGDHNDQLESECLQLGAWDFVTKPYNPITLILRLRNIIGRSQMYLMHQIQELAERDVLTGLYNRRFFMRKTERMLHTMEEQQFVLIHVDVDNFRLYNASFGSSAGDVLLKEIAEIIVAMCRDNSAGNCTYGRLESDVFCICFPYEKEQLEQLLLEAEQRVQQLCSTYRLKISFGLYVIENIHQDMEEMYAHTVEAVKKCKNNLNTFFAYYDREMNEKEKQAQKYTNGLEQAIKNREFQVYLQPKYSIDTNRPCGAEALVRWLHPQWGLVMPGQFIPVFEQNGLISQLDYYMWESVCMLLSQWKKQGKELFPLSVNISRVSMYNPQMVEQIEELTNRYDIPRHILNLEITESAYMSNPDLMKEIIERLRQLGFVIMMDDFGSGYSSLNTLKDIDVDILKIDMKFLPAGHNNAKSEKILASISRMAGWLGMPVVVEGVETLEQKEFLESIGCTYVQGYYYAKPMPVKDYEKLMEEQKPIHTISKENSQEILQDFDAIWSSDSKSGTLLKSVSVPFCIMEYVDSQVDILRINQAFREIFGSGNLERFINHKESYKLLSTLDEVVLSGKYGECECLFIMPNGQSQWQRIRLNYIGTVGQINLISATFADVSIERMLERELNSVFHALHNTVEHRSSILVIDDLAVSRDILCNLLEDEYNILQAEDGQEGLEVLRAHTDEIVAILLDMVMPNMNGQEFLAYKNNISSAADIPVIVISTEDSAETQIHMLELGVNDYITKPFVPVMVKKRLNNVLEYSSRFRNLVKEYHDVETIESTAEAVEENAITSSDKEHLQDMIYTDPLTGAYNRRYLEEMLFLDAQRKEADYEISVIFIDIRGFKQINDLLGYQVGDKVLKEFVKTLHTNIRSQDSLIRFGGDEFVVILNQCSKDQTAASMKRLEQALENVCYGPKDTINLEIDLGYSYNDKFQKKKEILQKMIDEAKTML